MAAYNQHEGDPFELPSNIAELENNAGIHVTDYESLRSYTTQLIKAYEHCTHIAEWELTGQVYAKTGKGQDFIARRYPLIPKLLTRSLEPYYTPPSDHSWMQSIKGKRILIIHPFVKTIEQQLTVLRDVFPNRSWFEDCTFTVVAPPQTLAGNHLNQSWDIHYNAFIAQLTPTAESYFDVALVAAGGYGMLIADMIYTKMGKSVMYIGGALQLFFGIIGRRWFENKDIMSIVNDAWIRPISSDKPMGCGKVEKGCYW